MEAEVVTVYWLAHGAHRRSGTMLPWTKRLGLRRVVGGGRYGSANAWLGDSAPTSTQLSARTARTPFSSCAPPSPRPMPRWLPCKFGTVRKRIGRSHSDVQRPTQGMGRPLAFPPMGPRRIPTARQPGPTPGARRRGHAPDPDLGRQREVVDAFFAAARQGDLDALVAVLHPDVVLRSDGGMARRDATAVVHGAASVSGRAVMFHQPNALVRPALVNGAAGVVVTVDGEPFSVIGFTVTDGRIAEIDALADPNGLRRLDLAVLDE